MAGYLLDANVLIRSLHVSAAQHELASSSIAILEERGERICVPGQVLVELWSVATRPANVNGLGWPVEDGAHVVGGLWQRFLVPDDPPDAFAEWFRLASAYRVSGRRVHDLRLVAVAMGLGASHVLTFNVDDFRAFTEITVVHPRQVVSGTP